MTDIIILLIKAINLYKYILIARILLSWLPNINWYNQPFRFLNDVTEPVMTPFRRLIPTIGGLDISPLLLFFVLELLQKALAGMLVPSGLGI